PKQAVTDKKLENSFYRSAYVEQMKIKYETDPNFTARDFYESLLPDAINEGSKELAKGLFNNSKFKKHLYHVLQAKYYDEVELLQTDEEFAAEELEGKNDIKNTDKEKGSEIEGDGKENVIPDDEEVDPLNQALIIGDGKEKGDGNLFDVGDNKKDKLDGDVESNDDLEPVIIMEEDSDKEQFDPSLYSDALGENITDGAKARGLGQNWVNYELKYYANALAKDKKSPEAFDEFKKSYGYVDINGRVAQFYHYKDEIPFDGENQENEIQNENKPGIINENNINNIIDDNNIDNVDVNINMDNADINPYINTYINTNINTNINVNGNNIIIEEDIEDDNIENNIDNEIRTSTNNIGIISTSSNNMDIIDTSNNMDIIGTSNNNIGIINTSSKNDGVDNVNKNANSRGQRININGLINGNNIDLEVKKIEEYRKLSSEDVNKELERLKTLYDNEEANSVSDSDIKMFKDAAHQAINTGSKIQRMEEEMGIKKKLNEDDIVHNYMDRFDVARNEKLNTIATEYSKLDTVRKEREKESNRINERKNRLSNLKQGDIIKFNVPETAGARYLEVLGVENDVVYFRGFSNNKMIDNDMLFTEKKTYQNVDGIHMDELVNGPFERYFVSKNEKQYDGLKKQDVIVKVPVEANSIKLREKAIKKAKEEEIDNSIELMDAQEKIKNNGFNVNQYEKDTRQIINNVSKSMKDDIKKNIETKYTIIKNKYSDLDAALAEAKVNYKPIAEVGKENNIVNLDDSFEYEEDDINNINNINNFYINNNKPVADINNNPEEEYKIPILGDLARKLVQNGKERENGEKLSIPYKQVKDGLLKYAKKGIHNQRQIVDDELMDNLAKCLDMNSDIKNPTANDLERRNIIRNAYELLSLSPDEFKKASENYNNGHKIKDYNSEEKEVNRHFYKERFEKKLRTEIGKTGVKLKFGVNEDKEELKKDLANASYRVLMLDYCYKQLKNAKKPVTKDAMNKEFDTINKSGEIASFRGNVLGSNPAVRKEFEKNVFSKTDEGYIDKNDLYECLYKAIATALDKAYASKNDKTYVDENGIEKTVDAKNELWYDKSVCSTVRSQSIKAIRKLNLNVEKIEKYRQYAKEDKLEIENKKANDIKKPDDVKKTSSNVAKNEAGKGMHP
ncbi:MAG: hypothetical protein K6G11_05685, partial [Lachnospiraceae bacterium]|nr:hypothetical protein [Lachnospiraceae bacterium]